VPEQVTIFSAWNNRVAKILGFGVGILFLVYLVKMMLKYPNALVDVYAAAVGVAIVVLAVGLVRTFRSGFYLFDDHLVVRTSYRTFSWPWPQIAKADIHERVRRYSSAARGTGRSGHMDQSRYYVVAWITLRSGKVQVLQGLKVLTDGEQFSTWVEDAVRAINLRVDPDFDTLERGA
jgi:hypothetical protein